MMKPARSSRRNSSSSSRRRNSCAKSAAILSTASLGICAASLAPLADCSPASALANDASRCRGVLSQQRQQRALRAAQSGAQAEAFGKFENPAYGQQQRQQSSTSDPSDDAQAPAAQEGGLGAHYKYPWCDSESDPDCYSAGSSSSGGGGECDEYDPEESDAGFSRCSNSSGSHGLRLSGASAAKNFADFGRSYRHPFYPGPCSSVGSGSSSSSTRGSCDESGTYHHQYQQQHHEDKHEHQHQLRHHQHQHSGHPLQHHAQNHHHHRHQQQQQHQLRSSSAPSSPFFSHLPPFLAGAGLGAGVRVAARAAAAAGIALAVLAPLFRALSSHWAYFVAGGICAAVSHTAAVPLDVLKTRIQCASPGEYRGTWDALVRICRSEGTQALFCGAGATLVGYAMQGSLKFGFFEFLKPLFARLFSGHGGGSGGAISAASSPVLGSLVAASVAAEIVGSSALTPLEAARIRMVADRDFATGLRSGIARIVSEEGLGALGRGLPAVLAKQIPYTVTKLVTFDVFVRSATKAVRSRAGGKGVSGGGGGGAGRVGQAWVTVGCAVAAGMLSSLASQPGDSLLSALHSEGRSKQHDGSGRRGSGSRGVGGGNSCCGSSEGESTDSEENLEAFFNEETFEDTVEECFEVCFEERDGFADREPVTHALARIARETGFLGLFRGTAARMLHVTSIVTLQLLIYQTVKRMVGIAT